MTDREILGLMSATIYAGGQHRATESIKVAREMLAEIDGAPWAGSTEPSTKTDTIEATYAKVGDGWGVRVPGPVSVGMIVRVRTKSGKARFERVTEIIRNELDKFTGVEVTICAVAPKEGDHDPL